jgi:hypothetical protein
MMLQCAPLASGGGGPFCRALRRDQRLRDGRETRPRAGSWGKQECGSQPLRARSCVIFSGGGGNGSRSLSCSLGGPACRLRTSAMYWAGRCLHSIAACYWGARHGTLPRASITSSAGTCNSLGLPVERCNAIDDTMLLADLSCELDSFPFYLWFQ